MITDDVVYGSDRSDLVAFDVRGLAGGEPIKLPGSFFLHKLVRKLWRCKRRIRTRKRGHCRLQRQFRRGYRDRGQQRHHSDPDYDGVHGDAGVWNQHNHVE